MISRGAKRRSLRVACASVLVHLNTTAGKSSRERDAMKLAGGLMQSQYGGRVCDDWTKQAAACTAAIRPTDRPTDLIFRIHRIAWELGTGYVRSRLHCARTRGTFRALLPRALFARSRRVSLVCFLRIPWPPCISYFDEFSCSLFVFCRNQINWDFTCFFFFNIWLIFLNNIIRLYNIENWI